MLPGPEPHPGPDPEPDPPREVGRARRFLVILGALALLAAALTAALAIVAGARFGEDGQILILSTGLNIVIGVSAIAVSRHLQRPNGRAWRIAMALTIVVVILAGRETLALLSPDASGFRSLWGSVGRLFVGVLTIQALVASRGWHGVRP